MNKYKIEFSKEAREDLIGIYTYVKYKLQEANIAQNLIKKMQEEIYKLEDFPKKHSIIDDEFIRKLEIRKLIIENYIVFYRVQDENETVQIVRIMYARRNWIDYL